MFIMGVLIIIFLLLAIISYPFYNQPLIPFLSNGSLTEEFSEKDSLLSAISELEEDFQMGRISSKDYDNLKNYFHRKYIKEKQNS